MGENPKDRYGVKKVPYELLPPVFAAYVAEVMRNGAEKYGAFNWRSTPVRATVYLAAAMRHLFRMMDGEDLDPESGLPHAAHVAASMAILLDATVNECLVDDRYKTGRYGAVADSLTKK